MVLSFLGSQQVESGGIANTRPRLVTAAGTAHVKGSYSTAHFTATTSPASWVQVDIMRPLHQANYLLDVGIGAAAAEQVLIANLPVTCRSSSSPSMGSWLFPLFIPAGSRLAARCQSTTTGSTLDCQLTLFAPLFGGELGLGQVEACGAVTASSIGTAVDPGGTANTKGTTPTQLIASTSFAYKWACVSINHTNALAATTSWTVDLMVGAGGSEVVVVPDLAIHCGSAGDTNPAIGMCFPLAIPAGSRISARAQCSGNVASERLLELVLHGVG